MGQNAQTDFTVLAVIASGPQGRSQVSLEHAKDGFDLPTLAISFLGESLFHQSAIASPHRKRLAVLSRAATLCRRDDAANAVSISTELVKSFGLIAGIAQKTPERLMVQRLMQRLLRLHSIHLGTTIDHDPEDQMVGRIADRRKLRVSMLVGDFGGSALKITISGLRRHSRTVKSALTCHRIGEERGRVCDLQINVVASTRWLRGS